MGHPLLAAGAVGGIGAIPAVYNSPVMRLLQQQALSPRSMLGIVGGGALGGASAMSGMPGPVNTSSEPNALVPSDNPPDDLGSKVP